jgi:putative ABC transport system permease protein
MALSRAFETMLFGLNPLDPITYAAVAALLFTVAVAACYVPARRAMRADPVLALKHL